ncbi:hypothetical protein ACWDMY_04720, partial [Streptomyces globisporus]
ASAVVHEATFEKYPVIAELLDPLARKLTTEAVSASPFRPGGPQCPWQQPTTLVPMSRNR